MAAYWYPFREIDHVDADGTVVRPDLLKAGTMSDDAHALWTFDQKLRLLLLEALEQIEVALRVRTAHCIGAQDPFAHLNATYLDTARCLAPVQTPQGTMTAHQWWVSRYEDKPASTHDDILRLYRSHWELKPPAWVADELLDFGLNSSPKLVTRAISTTVDTSSSAIDCSTGTTSETQRPQAPSQRPANSSEVGRTVCAALGSAELLGFRVLLAWRQERDVRSL